MLGPLLDDDPAPPRVAAARAISSTRRRLAWTLRRLGVAGVGDVTRLFTMSIADLLDEWFVSPQMQGVLVGERRDRHVGRSPSAGTAYVMAHHKIGDVGAGPARDRGAFPRAAWAR